MTRFEVGKTYSTRSIGDYDCVFSFKVVARTEKTVTLESSGEKTTRRKVRLWDGVECCDPLGRYSMSPVIRANKMVS